MSIERQRNPELESVCLFLIENEDNIRMKTKWTFEIMELDEELVAVPVGGESENFHGVLKINETAADILRLLEKDTTESLIVDTLQTQYDGDHEQIKKYVHEYIELLMKEGIVE